jgi:UDP-N-acetylmuramyl tripeptide synthase
VDQQASSSKGHRIDSLGLVGHTVSVSINQHWQWSTETHTTNELVKLQLQISNMTDLGAKVY